MNNSTGRFLPIGSVVLLKNAKKKIMIIGHLSITSDKRIFDYTGIPYPNGYVNSKVNLVFDQSDIENVYAIGYQDDEYKEHLAKVEQSYNDAPKLSNGSLDVDAILAKMANEAEKAQKKKENPATSEGVNAYDDVELPSIDIED